MVKIINDDNELICRHCGFNYMHHKDFFIYTGTDQHSIEKHLTFTSDLTACTQIKKQIKMKERVREPSITMHYICEECHKTSEYSLIFHKGINRFTPTDYFNKI